MSTKSWAVLALISLSLFSYTYAQDSTRGNLQIVSDDGIETLQNRFLEQSKADGSFNGFRVQIYNGNKNETLKMRAQFISAFPDVPIYTLYEAPEYKIQAGDFRTRLEAEKFLTELQARLGNGLVVKTKINPPLI